MATLIICELLTLQFAMRAHSAARAFVEGEGLWSKSQKNAIISLFTYGVTHNEDDYAQFTKDLLIPDGQHLALVEYLKPNPDYSIIRKGLLQGNSHPDDIASMTNLIRILHHYHYRSQPIDLWIKADRLFLPLKLAATKYHRALRSTNELVAHDALLDVQDINDELTVLENEFSKHIGSGSRWLEDIILNLLTLFVFIAETIGITLTILLGRAISRGLKTLNESALEIGNGNFSHHVLINSKDELGQLADSLNEMGGLLKSSYQNLEARVKDRTEELSQSHDQLDIILRGITDGILVINPESAIVYANETAADYCGFASLTSFLKATTKEIYTRFDITDEKGTPLSPEEMPSQLVLRGKDNQEETLLCFRSIVTAKVRWLLVKATPVFNEGNKAALVVIILKDFTERKHNSDVIDELYHQAQKAIQIRDEFISIASHELNTPITTLSLQLQMAQRNINIEDNISPTPEKLTKTFEISRKQVDRLADLVEDLLDASRIQSGKFAFRFEKVNVSNVTNEIIQRLSPRLFAAQCEVQTNITENITVAIDQYRFEQLFEHLLSNAMKYAPKKPLKISLHQSNDFLELVVQDHGPGIAKENQEKVFHRFERMNTASCVSGLGLGLFIAREVVNGHRGRLKLSSELGQGSTFTAQFPLTLNVT